MRPAAGWIPILLLMMVFASARGGGPRAARAQAAAGPSDTVARDLAIAFRLPSVLAENGAASRSLLVEAIYQASILSGAAERGEVVTTGTLGPGEDGVRYTPAPADRLVVNADGRTHEFVLKKAEGDREAASASDWLAAPHVLGYTHRLGEEAAAEFTVEFDGAAFRSGIKGWIRLGELKLAAELAGAGRVSGISDFHGRESRTEYVLSGTIRGEGFAVEVSERHVETFVAANSVKFLTPGQRGSAGRWSAVLDTALRRGETAYRFQKAEVTVDRKVHGEATPTVSVQASGQVLKDGAAFGVLEVRDGLPVLRTASRVVPLELPPR